MPNPKVSVTLIVSRDCSSARSRSECKLILESPISYNFTVRIIQLALLKPCCIGHYTIDNRYEKNFNMHAIILNVKINISPLSSSPNAIVLQHAFLNQKSPNSKKKTTSNSNKLFYLDNSITKRFYSISVHFSDFHLLVVVERKITDNMDDIIINYLFDTARCLVTVYKFTYN